MPVALPIHGGETLAGVKARPRTLPGLPAIRLYLLPDELPTERVSEQEYHDLMAQPPYWAFCWGGGLALAYYLTSFPESVKGRKVVDLGAGSGIAGIAAKMAGAEEVHCVDIDPEALKVIGYNASLNGVMVTASCEIPEKYDVLLAADICYEETGMALVISELARNPIMAVVADSRFDNLEARLPGIELVQKYQAKTFPDLDEAPQFDTVHIFLRR